MTLMDVWIEFDEPIPETEWEGESWAKDTALGEWAASRSPFFPKGHEAFWKVKHLIETGKYQHDYEDYLAEYVIVPKEEIISLINELYSSLDHINKMLDELKAFVEKLPDNRMYKLYKQEI